MKKLIYTFVVLLSATMLWAGNGMGPSGVYLTIDGVNANYRISNVDWGSNSNTTALNGRPTIENQNFGEVSELLLQGGMAMAWADGNDYYTDETFQVQYCVYEDGASVPDWQHLRLNELTYRSGNDYRYEATNKGINLLSGLVGGKTYRLRVQLGGHKFWNDGSNSGSWDSWGDIWEATFKTPETYYFDFGPVGRESAAAVANPDGNGHYWNNIGAEVTVSPWKVSSTADYSVVTAANAATSIHIGYTGDLFLGNGAGGLSTPDAAKLGDLAVVNATRDYLFASNAEKCGIVISGLNKDKGYVFKIFASRSASDNRVSKFDIEGLTNTTGQLQAAGSNIGGTGVNQNNSNVYLSDIIFPDKDGKITIYVSKGTSGQYLPINCMRMQEFADAEKPVLKTYSALTLMGTGVEDNEIAMHLVAKKGETEGHIFETFCSLTNGGTIRIEDDEHTALYESTVTVETGIYRVRFNSDDDAPVLTKITRIGIGGNVTSTAWSSAAGTAMTYQGHGVWQETLTFNDYEGNDAKRVCWYMNSQWNPSIACFEGEEGKVGIKDDATELGFTTGDTYASPGEHVVTLDLRNFTYSFDCTGTVEKQVVFFGSSVCHGQGADNFHGYAYQLMQEHSDYTYLNNSINGNNTTNLLNRIYGNLLTSCSEYVVIGLGLGNEGIHGAANPDGIYNQWKTNMKELIRQAEEAGMKVIVTNNYPRGDYNSTDYGYAKAMNLEMNTWGVPVVNFLGALDDCTGNGQWAYGYQVDGDVYHPTEAGHYEFKCAFVPSLFDALAAGKAIPTRQATNGTNLSTKHIAYQPEGAVHPFTLIMRVQATATEDVVLGTITTNSGIKTLTLPAANADGQWHTYAFTHYYASGHSYTYIDGVQTTSVNEKIIATAFTLGDADYTLADLHFYRSAMNVDEITAVHGGDMIHASLDLYCPLNEGETTNLAQSTATISLEEKAFIFYVTGNGSDGNPWCDGKFWTVDGSLLEEGTITFVGVPAGHYEFKVTDGEWGAGHEFTTIDTENSAANVFGGNGNNITFDLEATADVTISFDGTKVIITATEPFAAHYYVAGNGSDGNPWCDGKNWTVDGCLLVDGTITFENVPAGSYEFKVTDGEWGTGHEFTALDKANSAANVYGGNGGNITFKLGETANVTIAFDGTKVVVTTTGAFLPKYYVTGNGNDDVNEHWCDHKNWTVNGSAMNSETITFYGVAAGNYGFKVTDGTWDHQYTTIDTEHSDKNVHGGSGSDISFTLDAEADVTITINDADKKIAVTSTLSRFVRLPYSIVGQEAVTGYNWDTETTATEMTRQSDGTYAFSIARVRLAEGDYQYKVVGGHNWDTYQYPSEGDNFLSIASTGYYKLDYTFNPANDALECVATLLENKQQVVISVYQYATLYAAETLWLPAGMHAYTVSALYENELVLDEILDNIIPATTGVILEGSPATYDFYYAPTASFEGTNLLKGTIAEQSVENDQRHYVLGVNSAFEVGLYWPAGTDHGMGAFTNGAGRAYLELAPASSPASVRGFALRHTDVVTGMHEVETMTDGLYYDVLGRAFAHPQAAGLYIHNGKQVLIVK